MKKLIITLTALLLVGAVVQAQDDLSSLNGKKAFRKALKHFNAFKLDQSNSGDDLLEAKRVIDFAIKQDDIKEDPKLWITMGEIYNSFSTYNETQSLLNPDHVAVQPNGGMIAFQAFKKALELKPADKAAVNGLREVIASVSNTGMVAYENNDYKGSFMAFRSIIDIHELLKEHGGDSPLDAEGELENQMYVTGLTAQAAGEDGTAKTYMLKLYELQYDRPAIYDVLYKLTQDEDSAKAEAFLKEGRDRFPDDVGLLFTEINHLLQAGRLDELVGRLQIAIEKEPQNVSLYSTLGSVYDQVYQDHHRKGDSGKAKEYFDLAKGQYEKAYQMDNTYTDAVYSIGALYYGLAAFSAEALMELSSDYSREGTQKYEVKKGEMEGYFEQALPYFKQVEKQDPNDRNTLIALKEIFARKNDFETSNIFKERLEKVEAGETLSKPYFQ